MNAFPPHFVEDLKSFVKGNEIFDMLTRPHGHFCNSIHGKHKPKIQPNLLRLILIYLGKRKPHVDHIKRARGVAMISQCDQTIELCD